MPLYAFQCRVAVQLLCPELRRPEPGNTECCKLCGRGERRDLYGMGWRLVCNLERGGGGREGDRGNGKQRRETRQTQTNTDKRNKKKEKQRRRNETRQKKNRERAQKRRRAEERKETKRKEEKKEKSKQKKSRGEIKKKKDKGRADGQGPKWPGRPSRTRQLRPPTVRVS